MKDLSKRIEFTQKTLKSFHVLFLIHTFHNLEDFFLFFTVILANLCLILYYIYRREKISKRYPSLKAKNSPSQAKNSPSLKAKNSPSLKAKNSPSLKAKNSPSLWLHGHFLTVPFASWEGFVCHPFDGQRTPFPFFVKNKCSFRLGFNPMIEGDLTPKSHENAPEKPSSTVRVIPSWAFFATCLIVLVQ